MLTALSVGRKPPLPAHTDLILFAEALRMTGGIRVPRSVNSGLCERRLRYFIGTTKL
jgi:hypothetical protein